jgi:hypothetical protein
MKAKDPNVHVRFLDTHTVVEVESVLNAEEEIVEKLWYQPHELKIQKALLKQDAREWRKTGLGILLQDAFVNPDPKKGQAQLNAFAQLGDTEYARGIERYLCRAHDEQRVERKRDFIQDVLEQWRYLDSLKQFTTEEKMVKLAEFSALQSKCAEVFARRMGTADETAVTKGEDTKAAQKLVSKLFRKQRRRNSIETSGRRDVMPTHESYGRRVSFPYGLFDRS